MFAPDEKESGSYLVMVTFYNKKIQVRGLLCFVFICLLFLIIVLIGCKKNHYAMYLNQGFELGNTLGWGIEADSSRKDSVRVTGSIVQPVRSGRYSARIELFPSKADEPRVEMADYRNAPNGNTVIYTFSIYIPKSWPDKSGKCVFVQWHGDPDKGEVYRYPPLALEYVDGDFFFRKAHSSVKTQLFSSKQADNVEVIYGSSNDNYKKRFSKKGVWHDFQIKAKWSCVNGWLSISVDGETVYEKSIPIGYNDKKGPFFKMGIYSDKVLDGMFAYFDGYRRVIVKDGEWYVA